MLRFIISLCFATTALAQQIIYVNHAASGSNDGSSWPNAYTDLQDALAHAAIHCNESPCEIWVAAGTYKPDRGTSDRFASFELSGQVSLYGGFAGWEECLDERDLANNSTVLDGDLLGNDDPMASSQSDCCQASFEPGCSDAACVELIDIIYPPGHCSNRWSFECVDLAGALCGELCRPTRSDNSIILLEVPDDVDEVVIDGFALINADAYCFGEEPGCRGLGALSIGDSAVNVRNCTFSKNRAMQDGGAALNAGNEASVHVERCLFLANDDGLLNLGASIIDFGSTHEKQSSFVDCDFLNNSGAALGYSGNGRIERCRFVGNEGSALSIYVGAPVVRDCLFMNNSGYVTMSTGNSTTIANCVFLNNDAEYALGVSGTDVVVNSVFVGSDSGIAVSLGNLTLINSVVFGNSMRGISLNGSALVLDSIIWGNMYNGQGGEASQIYVSPQFDPPTLLYNSIEGWTGSLGGIGNVGFDPMFVDPDGPDDILGTLDDDFRLSPDSPLIDLGHPNPPLYPNLDFDHHARILCDRIDIGAYEHRIGDFNCDDFISLSDFANFPNCLTGPAPVPMYADSCAAYDFIADYAAGTEDIDLLDFAGLQNFFFAP